MNDVAVEVPVTPISANAFAPFGEVIEPTEQTAEMVNGQRFERFDALASVHCGDAPVNVGIMRCATATTLPCEMTIVERHPLGSQAFLPLDTLHYIIAVAPPRAHPDPTQFRGFIVPPRTGINMRAGVWHVPLLGSRVGQTFAVIDRATEDNCDEITLSAPLRIPAAL
ncbi:MAG: ureidoglycolate lyase [Pseudomonadota bacterium]